MPGQDNIGKESIRGQLRGNQETKPIEGNVEGQGSGDDKNIDRNALEFGEDKSPAPNNLETQNSPLAQLHNIKMEGQEDLPAIKGSTSIVDKSIDR